ncbi:transposase [Oxalobacter sp. OxGP1]|uniref:transposase n=1 Tax=Oxalobacter paeniformigenes TaxID=2946594 RepID=UPI0022AFC5F3|nr:transposase [Oxalobacter paeniformigenes]MCZ4052234.1 transposase [Oxalobacter paeniformigenes]
MARSARLVIPGMPHHIYLQGNNRQDVFGDEEDYRCYLDWLREAARQYGVDIHAYALLKNRVYLLGTPSDQSGLARMMQWIGRHYVPYFNKKYLRSGTLWEGRFKTSVVETGCLMDCCRYMEMMPVTSGFAATPEAYEWSSYRHHAGIAPSPLIRDHAVYWELGNTPFGREMAYREQFFRAGIDDRLENILTMGWPLGSEAFIRQLEVSTQRQFRMGKRGRPEKFVSK